MSASNGLPADRKLGRYEIVAELGKGAMGTVYKANDPMLERTVALKTINLAVSANEMAEYEARFYQEAKAAGGLNHPNIVTIYDVGKTGDMPYLAMEYLEGSELHEILRHRKPLSAAHALEIAAQVADGLAYAHDRGVVHRDVKPANIMVVRDGLVKIADFGVARMRSSERGADTQVVGSPRYMSPEQVLRKRAEHRSDIFSLGMVLYEMLTGAPPFTGADLNAILFQIVNAEPARGEHEGLRSAGDARLHSREGTGESAGGPLSERTGIRRRVARVPASDGASFDARGACASGEDRAERDGNARECAVR